MKRRTITVRLQISVEETQDGHTTPDSAVLNELERVLTSHFDGGIADQYGNDLCEARWADIRQV